MPDLSQKKLPDITCPIKSLCESGWLSWGTSCYKMSDSTKPVNTYKLHFLNFRNFSPTKNGKTVSKTWSKMT